MGDQAVFHPGVANKRRSQPKKLKGAKSKENQSFLLHNTTWRLIPCTLEEKFAIDILQGNTYIQKKKSLEDSLEFIRKNQDKKFKNECLKKKKQCEALLLQNQLLRWLFKRFVNRWRTKRFKKINEVDCITLNPIQKPIFIVNFTNRVIYTFESDSILQHIHKKLLHHDGQMPEPLLPQNPFTNEKFSVFQLIEIYNQANQYGKIPWSYALFSKSQYSIDNFLKYHRKTLRIHALKSILFHQGDWDGIDLLLNFIESQHYHHGAEFNKEIYRWFLYRWADEGKITIWRELCFEFYKEQILADDDGSREGCFFAIAVKTGSLCAPPSDLFAKRAIFLGLKKDGSRSSSESI